MKKWMKGAATALAVTAVAAVALTGCSPASSSPVASAGDKAFVIGYDSYFVGNTWSAQLEAEFKSAAARNKKSISKVILTESDNNAQTQISNIQSMIARGANAIIVTPISPDGIAPVLAQAEAAGIKVILNGSPADDKGYTSYVNVDDKSLGATGATWLVHKLDGKGKIIALNGIAGIPTSDARAAGAKAVFAKSPGIDVVATADAGWDEATAKTAVESILAANPQIDGVWSQGGSMTLGAIEAFEAAGRPLVPMTGEDNNGLLKKWESLVKAGDTRFDCIAVAKPTWIAADALDLALSSLKGEKVKKDNILTPATITSATLAKAVRPGLPDSLWVNTRMTDAEIKKLYN